MSRVFGYQLLAAVIFIFVAAFYATVMHDVAVTVYWCCLSLFNLICALGFELLRAVRVSTHV